MMAMAKSADMSAVDSPSDAYLENGKEKIKARISARLRCARNNFRYNGTTF